MPTTSTNFHLVEGQWKNFTFRRIFPVDYLRVLEHVREYFIKEEQTCVLLGYSENFANQLLQVVQEVLKDNLSFLVEHSDTKELAAVRITFRQSETTCFDSIIPVENLNWKADVFFNGIDLTKDQKAQIFQQFGISEYAELLIVATSPKFRKQGLSMELYNRSLNFLRAEGFKLAKCIFTSPTTRRQALSLGFNEYHKIDYRCLKDRNGSRIFADNDLRDEHMAVIGLKLL